MVFNRARTDEQLYPPLSIYNTYDDNIDDKKDTILLYYMFVHNGNFKLH